RPGVARASLVAFLLLAAISWGRIILGDDSGISELFTLQTWQRISEFLGQLAGADSEGTPAFLSLESWRSGGKLAVETLAMSVLAAAMAGVAALLTFLPAASNVAYGELAGTGGRAGRVAFHVVRGMFVFSRSVPELLWAMIIVFMLSPGILPGAVALAIHNYGILGKLSAEVVEGLDTSPAQALRSAGAGKFQMLVYGILPQALPQFLRYLLYRWEVIIRTTVVVGFVAAGGLGHEFRLRMSWFQYDEITLLLVYYLLLVLLVDLVSAGLRRLAR
ncbi:MAG: ABC transporter permease subunit, partial [Chloroflexi bacterium]|nr:ABC transporter permease subunit [Chloroflexota bacterium]